MKAESKKYLDDMRPIFDRMKSAGTIDNIRNAGLFKKIDAQKVQNIIREFVPGYSYDLDSDAQIYQLMLEVYRRYDLLSVDNADKVIKLSI